MANAQKFTKASTGHMTAHFERRKVPVVDENGNIHEEYVHFGNQDIDPSKTHLNYNLGPDHGGLSQVEFIRKRIQEAHCMQRADVNVLVSWVVTLPTHNEHGVPMTYTPEQQRAYFQESYNMLTARYGPENVVSAYVHLDETTPHMHFAFVPVTEDRAWNKKHPDRPRDKVSAKEVLTRTDLQHFHTDLQEHLDARCGRGLYPVLNGATDGGNRSILELKAARAAEELAKVELALQDAKTDLEGVNTALQETQEELANTRDELEFHQDALERAGEVLSEQLDLAQDAQRRAEEATATVERLESKIEELEPRAEALQGDVATLESRRDGLRDEIGDLRAQISDLQEVMRKKEEEASRYLGSMEAVQERIRQNRAEEEKAQRLEALEEVAAATPENQRMLQEALLRQAARRRSKKRNGPELGS